MSGLYSPWQREAHSIERPAADDALMTIIVFYCADRKFLRLT